MLGFLACASVSVTPSAASVNASAALPNLRIQRLSMGGVFMFVLLFLSVRDFVRCATEGTQQKGLGDDTVSRAESHLPIGMELRNTLLLLPSDGTSMADVKPRQSFMVVSAMV